MAEFFQNMISIGRDIAAYVVAISILVAFHEYGHFWAARRLGVRVLRFSIGFGKPLWQHRGADGVDYVVASIPLGGYVKLLDEREGPVPESERKFAFNNRPVAARAAIYAAGPAFNFILAAVLYWWTLVYGVPSYKPVIGEPAPQSIAQLAGLKDGDVITRVNGVPVNSWDALQNRLLKTALASAAERQTNLDLSVVPGPHADPATPAHVVHLDLSHAHLEPEAFFSDLGLRLYQIKVPPVLGEIVKGYPAQQAGLKEGDKIVAINGQAIESFQQLQALVAARPGQIVRFDYLRNEQPGSLQILLATEKNGDRVVGRLGAGAVQMAKDNNLWQDLQIVERLDPIAAIPEALIKTGHESVMVVQVLYRMVCGDISIRNLSGPITTAQAAGSAASVGISTFLMLVAFVSLNVGIVNLLPIPVLDGGQIVNCLIEAVKGSPLSERAQLLVQQLGFTLLILIMGFAVFNDIARQIG